MATKFIYKDSINMIEVKNMKEKKLVGRYVYVYTDNLYIPYIEIDGKEQVAWNVPRDRLKNATEKELQIIDLAKTIKNMMDNDFKDVTFDQAIEIKQRYEKLVSEASKETSIEKWQETTNTDIITPHQDEYSIFDKLDEQQIMEEMEGKVITEYFYNFQIGGREVTGISWAGTKAIARYMSMQNREHGYGGIEVMPIDPKKDIIEDDKYITVIARAVDHGTGLIMMGISRQPKYIIRKDGTTVADEFALVKACSKAMRNAIRALIPESLIIEMYNQWRAGKR